MTRHWLCALLVLASALWLTACDPDDPSEPADDATTVAIDTTENTTTVPVCTTDIPAPSGSEPEELVRWVEDSPNDLLLHQPFFNEVYPEAVFDASVPAVLDITAVEVLSEGGLHTVNLHLNADDEGGGVVEEMERPDQLLSYGLYIDSDGNGVSDFIVSTTDDPARGVILSPEFEQVEELPGVYYDEFGHNVISLPVPEGIVGRTFDWVAFAGYSPDPGALFTTAIEGVSFLPPVDNVASWDGMMAVISSYSGPGSCQITDSRTISSSGASSATCPAKVGPYSTVPGTSTSGKLWYRKMCGNRGVEFWCFSNAFGSRIVDGGVEGWIGKCPYDCGSNYFNVWKQDPNQLDNLVHHQISDADCYDKNGNVVKKKDHDSDGWRDIMDHKFAFTTGQVVGCNWDWDESSSSAHATRCCPSRAPYKNRSDVPGSAITGSPPNYSCHTTAP